MDKLRVGLLIDDLNMPFWEYKMIEAINAGGYAEIVVAVKRKSPAYPRKGFFGKLKENLSIGCFKVFTKAENAFYKPSPNAFEEKNIKELIKSSAIIEVDCIEKKFSDYISDNDIREIKKYNVDVFIRLGFRILRGEILKTAKMGVWSYHHGDNFFYRGGPAGVWEFLKREKTVGSILQILTEDLDGGEVLYRSWSQVYTSLNKTLNGFYWKTSLFIPRKLKELHESGEKAFFIKVKAESEGVQFYSGRNYTIPTNYQFLKLFIPFLISRIKHKIWKTFNYEQWILLYAFSNNNSFSTSMYRYKRLTPPSDRYWADPCVIHKDGKHYLFFEEVVNPGKNERGHLSVVEVDKKGFKSEPVIILKKPYHLSYPFVFEHKGEYYLIPESDENSSIQLYRAVNFPYEWEFKMNLMENIKAVDTTILYKDNRVWLFTNIPQVEGASYSEELFLFSSDNLFTTEWESHPCNPVVSDVKSSRPAGRLFYNNGKLYRPSQDCSSRYGYATVINEIIALNKNEYKEIKVSDITPGWANDVVATHTLSFDQGLSVIDATIRRRKNPLSFLQKK
jgi:hypothetical protein